MDSDLKLVTKGGRAVNVRPDTIDFRDRMFEPTLIEVPAKRDLNAYRRNRIPVLNQGAEGACTGYGLATVINYLLRTRNDVPDLTEVSPHMIYFLARKYDEWPGEQYEGSSPRGAMKGWHKHGVSSREFWGKEKRLSPRLAEEAVKRPLGAYYRVNHKDLVAMHSAITEVGVLYASALVHEGWENAGPDGIIRKDDKIYGGHAFAVVAYDENGFWIQNSWGEKWGYKGFGHISYDDWLTNGTDVWVARLGVPMIMKSRLFVPASNLQITSSSDARTHLELRRHIISIGNKGELKTSDTYGNEEEDVQEIFEYHIPSVTRNWKRKRVLLYAHGGLVNESAAVQRVTDSLPVLLDAGVYPVSFIWHSDYWSTLKAMLEDAVMKRRPEGFMDAGKDFMLDRLDDALEPLARMFTGKAQWDEMKENALAATKEERGGARLAAGYVKAFVESHRGAEIHMTGHSAGAIFLGAVVELLASWGLTVKTCTVWAPACTMTFFKEHYLPAIRDKRIGKFTLFTLSDTVEQDDNCASIYHKSLLYLVSNAFEDRAHIPLIRKDGEPLLGMEKFVRQDRDVSALFRSGVADWIISPNSETDVSQYSTALHHGDFDDDVPTVTATLARILGREKIMARFSFNRSSSSLREKRLRLTK